MVGSLLKSLQSILRIEAYMSSLISRRERKYHCCFLDPNGLDIRQNLLARESPEYETISPLNG
jgi:hypothetical protein